MFPYVFDETQEVDEGVPRRMHARLLPVQRGTVGSCTEGSSTTAGREGETARSPGAALRGAIVRVLEGRPCLPMTSDRAWDAASSGGRETEAVWARRCPHARWRNVVETASDPTTPVISMVHLT